MAGAIGRRALYCSPRGECDLWERVRASLLMPPVSRCSHCVQVSNYLKVAGLGSLWDSEHPSPRKVTRLHDDSVTALTPFLTVQKEVEATMTPMQERSLVIEDVPGPPDGPHILRLNGPLILTTLADFQSKVRADWSHNLILDFTNVPYLDSAGIGALAWVHVRHHRDNNGVSLVGVVERVHDALKLAHLDQFFQFFDSLSDARPNASRVNSA